MPELTLAQWLLALLAAAFVGVSKTGLPGAGVVVVPLMAAVFAGRLSPGALLPMLIVGDLFAVAWYRRHTQWPLLVGLVPWVLGGIAVGTWALWTMGQSPELARTVERTIAVLVLAMIGVHLARKRLGERFQPTSALGRVVTGSLAGFSTTVSNAAGPLTNMYLASAKIPKEQFMGTAAWFYLTFNLVKVPVFVGLTVLQPHAPMITDETLLFNLCMVPAIVCGVFVGRWLLHRIAQDFFEGTVILLAGVTCLYLLFR